MPEQPPRSQILVESVRLLEPQLCGTERLDGQLKAAPEEHTFRVVEQGDMRPMSGHSEAMHDLRDLYGKADAQLDTSGKSVEQSFNALKRLVAEAPFRG